VRYGYGKPEELARSKPDYWVNDLRELALPGNQKTNFKPN
jgi:hypothetical protein